jgi:hypothetical protein
MLKLKQWVYSILFAAIATLASSLIRQDVRTTYPEIFSCERSCQVAAAGWPFPYLVDYPGLSPSGSADLGGAVLGADKLWIGSLGATFISWFALIAGVLFLWRLGAARYGSRTNS